MSSLATPVPTALEQAEKVLPTVLDDFNQRLVDARHKASARKSVLLESELVQRARSQARRLFGKPEAEAAQAAEAEEVPSNLSEAHVSFRSPLAEQIGSYQDLISTNIDAIFKRNIANTEAEVRAELARWIKLIQDEALPGADSPAS